MDDNIPLLALNMTTHPRAYGLLLGSGLSSAAGIPTGYELMLALVRRLALARDEACEPDPEGWLRDTVGIEPDYSALLEYLARTPEERRALVSAYFEPTPEEKEQGRRAPTAAHRSIARLVGKGYVSVIITTNFDHLLERAISDEGISPVLLSTQDQVIARRPIHFNDCTIVKVHGDYLDSRIRNTAAELASYDEDTNELLDRILDEHGIVVCGWSSTWDTALRSALDRCPSHRFTTYWARRSAPSEEEQRLMDRRRAALIRIESADGFFEDMERTIEALEKGRIPGRVGAGRLLTPQGAVSLLEADLDDPGKRIQVTKLLRDQVAALAEATSLERFPVQEGAGAELPSEETVRERIHAYDDLSETCVALMAAGCYFARPDQAPAFAEMLRTQANAAASPGSGFTAWIELRQYPALLLLYAAGVASVAAGRYATLEEISRTPVTSPFEEDRPAALALVPDQVVTVHLGKAMPEVLDRAYTPTSEYLFSRLREPLRQVVRPEVEYERSFNRFEYLMALIQADMSNGRRFHVGRFGWTVHHSGAHENVIANIGNEIESQGADWAPLKEGLFGADIDRLTKARDLVDGHVGQLSWW